jgi:hypothetical protein
MVSMRKVLVVVVASLATLAGCGVARSDPPGAYHPPTPALAHDYLVELEQIETDLEALDVVAALTSPFPPELAGPNSESGSRRDPVNEAIASFFEGLGSDAHPLGHERSRATLEALGGLVADPSAWSEAASGLVDLARRAGTAAAPEASRALGQLIAGVRASSLPEPLRTWRNQCDECHCYGIEPITIHQA